jgi:hypothetical protein
MAPNRCQAPIPTFFSFCPDPLVIVIFRNGKCSSPEFIALGKIDKCFFRKQGRKRPQFVVEDSNLTATSAFPALAILRP